MAKSFGKLVEELRQERGLSVYAVARQAGLSDQAIHDLEQTDRLPSLDTARRLARVLSVSLDWIDGQLPPVELPTAEPARPRGRPPTKSAPAGAAEPAPRKRKPSRRRAE